MIDDAMECLPGEVGHESSEQRFADVRDNLRKKNWKPARTALRRSNRRRLSLLKSSANHGLQRFCARSAEEGEKRGVSTASSPILTWSIAGEADLNADGKADLLWRNPSNGAARGRAPHRSSPAGGERRVTGRCEWGLRIVQRSLSISRILFSRLRCASSGRNSEPHQKPVDIESRSARHFISTPRCRGRAMPAKSRGVG